MQRAKLQLGHSRGRVRRALLASTTPELCREVSSCRSVRDDAGGWFASFFAVVIGGASILLATWAIWLIADPHELIHVEYAIPALLLALLGAVIAVFLWRRSGM